MRRTVLSVFWFEAGATGGPFYVSFSGLFCFVWHLGVALAYVRQVSALISDIGHIRLTEKQ